MRRRPDVTVYLRPAKGLPGANLQAEIVLKSGADTPTEGIQVDLTGVERFAVPAGNHQQIVEKMHLGKRATFPARVLTKGEHRMAVRFDIPAEAPASYSRNASVQYVIEVAVKIPWWLDRHARFEVPVRSSPVRPPPAKSMLYSTHPQGSKGKDLVIEASLDRDVVTPGLALSGAVALQHVAAHTIKRVKLALLGFEEPSGAWRGGLLSGSPPVREAVRYEHVLVEGAPGEAAPTRFSIRIPQDAPPTFDAFYFRFRWYIEVIAEVRWGSDVSLRAPIAIYASEPDVEEPEAKSVPVPPVGRDRRALVWAAVATRAGLSNDAEHERMLGKVGDVAITISLEERGEGLHCVAALAWPSLGLDLELHERGWTEALKLGEVSLDGANDGAGFKKRLALYGRDHERVGSLFQEETLRATLLRFDEVHLDDEGAALASANAVSGVDELGPFVSAAMEASRMLAFAIDQRSAPPKVMSGALDAWRSLASRLGGRLELGRMWIHDASIRGERAELGTRWNKDNQPTDTTLRVPLDAALETELDIRDPAKLEAPIGPLVTEILSNLPAKTLRVGPTAIEASLPAPLVDANLAESLLERMSQLARALRTGKDLGPYR